jgi:hypothetical protein
MVRFVYRLTNYVSSGVRSRGSRYFKAGYVTLQNGGPDKVEALVRGSQVYRVTVQLEGDREVMADCSCPYHDGVCRGDARADRCAAKGGVSVLLAEHSLDFVLSLSDRVYILEKGEVKFTGPPADVRANEGELGVFRTRPPSRRR